MRNEFVPSETAGMKDDRKRVYHCPLIWDNLKNDSRIVN